MTELTDGGASSPIDTPTSISRSEADVVVISCVRAPDESGRLSDQLGFVADERRFNVALTRAKHALIVVGHADALDAGGGHVRGLVRDARSAGDVVDSEELLRTAS